MADGSAERSEDVPEGQARSRHSARWGLVALLLLAAGVGVLAIQNTRTVPLKVFWLEFSIPLVVLVVATAVVTLALENLIQMIVRWRRYRLLRSRKRPPDGVDGRE